jgi:2-haloacid dehalogenase
VARVPVRALLFDVFGTLVDWRTSITRALRAFGSDRAIECDWEGLVDAWRAAYAPSMERVRRGESQWRNLDALHGASFDEIAVRFGLPELGARDRAWIVRRWHELDPWPDVRSGLVRLRSRYITGTLSNGNVALLVDLMRFADLRMDAVFSAELFAHYKPDPQTYLGAAKLLALAPPEVMLVAAHNADLRAAAALGLRTAFVLRPAEYGPQQTTDRAAGEGIDITVRDLAELADLLCD